MGKRKILKRSTAKCISNSKVITSGIRSSSRPDVQSPAWIAVSCQHTAHKSPGILVSIALPIIVKDSETGGSRPHQHIQTNDIHTLDDILHNLNLRNDEIVHFGQLRKLLAKHLDRAFVKQIGIYLHQLLLLIERFCKHALRT